MAKPAILERDRKILAQQAAFAAAAVIEDLLELAQTLPAKFNELVTNAPELFQRLQEEAPAKFTELTDQVPTLLGEIKGLDVDTLRERATKTFDEAVALFEKEFDSFAADGQQTAAKLMSDERFMKVVSTAMPKIQQARTTINQVVEPIKSKLAS